MRVQVKMIFPLVSHADKSRRLSVLLELVKPPWRKCSGPTLTATVGLIDLGLQG